MDSDLKFRDDIARELAGSNPPPLGTMVAEAMAAARKLRRRRRLVLLGGGGAATALVAVGLVLAVTIGGSGPAPAGATRIGAAADPTVTAAPKENSAPPAATAVSIPPGHKATTGQAVVAVLMELAPVAGGRLSEFDVSTDVGYAAGGFLVDDGHGAATLSASVSNREPDYGPAGVGMQCPPNEAGFTCARSVNPDGIVVRVMTMGPYTTDCTELKCSLKDLRVEIKRPDGVYVTVETFNGPFGQGRGATRADTLLTGPQLFEIASNPRWGLTMLAEYVDQAAQNIHPSAK